MVYDKIPVSIYVDPKQTITINRAISAEIDDESMTMDEGSLLTLTSGVRNQIKAFSGSQL